MRLNSVKRRVALSSVLLCLAVITASTIWVYLDTRRAIIDVKDERLQDLSESLLKVLLLTAPSVIGGDQNPDPETVFANIASKMSSKDNLEKWSRAKLFEDYFAFLLLDSKGAVLVSSPNAPPVDLKMMRHPGFNDIQDLGQSNMWRGVTMLLTQLKTGEPMWLWLGEDKRVRREAENKIMLPAILPMLVATPILCLLLVLFTYHLFAPINRLEKEVSEKSIDNLSPLNMTDVPTELYSLVKRLNYLFDQVDAAWQREKRFNQDAAHELRTPLAVIKLNAQNALETQSAEEKDHDLRQIEKSITRSERTIEQLLTLAKVEGGLIVDLSQTVDVAQILRNVIADLVPLALKQQQKITLEADDKTYAIQGNEILLNCLFRNLMDNAIRYSGEGTRIGAKVIEHEEHVHVVITDNGRGMSQIDIDRIFERFFRGKETQNKAQGVGLGMAIVERVITIHQGEVDVRSLEPGLAFIITLPKSRFI
ncbi:two-component sensor histidine kinase [Vibrio qinghaiensis]|uniref:histidine kinase n=1 Tax=Vibrio qinghaiensis TaxID=2025808 RepID=A0A223N3J7_9VIBR|nr:ATP-binding protein [Vibrio qinghaiensis]ASU24348.1 two-component sensor histidine kinase [Vibrio qinghaiensis]